MTEDNGKKLDKLQEKIKTEINITYWEREIGELQNKKECAELNLKREIKNLKDLKEVENE